MKRWGAFWPLVLLLGLVACTAQGSGSVIPTPTPFLAPQQLPSPTIATMTVVPSPTVAEVPSPLPSPTLAPTFTPTFTPTPGTGSINGVVWQDVCPQSALQAGQTDRCREYEQGWVGNGEKDQGELGLAGLRVRLAQGECPGTPLSITATNVQGAFLFDGLPPGTYCVSIDPQDPQNQALLGPGVWTRPGMNQNALTVTVMPGKTVTLTFAYSPLVTLEGTPTPMAANVTPTAVAKRPTSPRELGEPDVLDTMDNPKATWNLRWDDYLRTTYRNGLFTLHLWQPRAGLNWVLSKYPPLRNAYIEALFKTGPVCAHKDSYGLLVRAPTKYEGYAFVVSCDGMRKILRWNGGLVVFAPWDWAKPLNPEEQGQGVYQSYPLHTGPNQINRIGVWMEGDTMRMYVNRILVAEIQDDFFPEGYFGLVIGGESSGFRVHVDQVAYWELP